MLQISTTSLEWSVQELVLIRWCNNSLWIFNHNTNFERCHIICLWRLVVDINELNCAYFQVSLFYTFTFNYIYNISLKLRSRLTFTSNGFCFQSSWRHWSSHSLLSSTDLEPKIRQLELLLKSSSLLIYSWSKLLYILPPISRNTLATTSI
jgi:hypothetical protein